MIGADTFHAHLDACVRCREQPFNLCEHGAELLRLAATTIAPHAHVCAAYMRGDTCDGPCVCACGAVLSHRPDWRDVPDANGPNWWRTPAGEWHKFPDPNEPQPPHEVVP
jgi:hypothetical protein